ncbi:hypothetical protein [Myroides indicus]|uniref:Uncharacterized protein n=1 Tax=Myroides indicus TaxID=1323422 RepID=A0A4R7EU22_9FLAO|nr:hypothetical protein [Myroides indicus]TDS56556.1 hypothetical protein C8P70_12056 [Myroides indicus]
MNKILSVCINCWVDWTGTKQNLKDVPWLVGPYGKKEYIGGGFYKEFAEEAGLEVNDDYGGGLVSDFFEALECNDINRGKLDAAIKHFYEHTAEYKLDVWSEWYHPVKYFAHILIKTVSSGIDQLNIPLKPLETSRGISNEVIVLKDAKQKQIFACWLRRAILTNKVTYAGFYSIIKINEKPFIRVVFPLPKGSATVLLRVSVQSDGSVKLISDGKKPGGAGYYRVKVINEQVIRYKFIPLKEVIHVYSDSEKVLRTDHIFWYWGMKFLQLHYKINPIKE